MLYCPKCKAVGANLHWYREYTITGPIASIKCSSCSWLSGIIIDGRKKINIESEELPDYSHLLPGTHGSNIPIKEVEVKEVEIIKEVEVFRPYTFSHKGVVIAFELEDAEIMKEFLEEGSKLPDFRLASDIATIINAFQLKKLVWK